jgi:hypothetical protein
MSIVQTTTQQIVKKVKKVSKEQKPKKKLIIIMNDDSDDDDVPVVATVVVKGKKVEIFFPEEVWRYIKQIAGYGMRRTCDNYDAMVAMNHRSAKWLSSPMILCGEAKTFCVPIYSILSNERYARDEMVEFNPDDVKLVCEKKWFCGGCVESGKSYSSNDIITYRAIQRKEQKKRSVKNTAEKLMKDCHENYYKDFTAEWKRRHNQRLQEHKRRIKEHNEYLVERQTAKANKEQFVKDLAQMLCEGTLNYDDFSKIMGQVINLFGTSAFTKPNWREEFMEIPLRMGRSGCHDW